MIHRSKDFDNPPAGLIDFRWDTLKSRLLVEKHVHRCETKCYRDSTIEELSTLYENKCAFCERERGTELEVDHYRPKKPRMRGAVEYRQPGYYWLTYEWSNLIPLCSKCNRFKSTKFPLAHSTTGSRIEINHYIGVDNTIPGDLYDLLWLNNQEQPLIINPEVDNIPERHFRFLPNGKIEGRTREGEETEDVCNLNRRDLVRERKKIVNNIVRDIEIALDKCITSEEPDIIKYAKLEGALETIFIQIGMGRETNHQFSLLYNYIYYQFQTFISSQLPSHFAGKVLNYFNGFKRKVG